MIYMKLCTSCISYHRVNESHINFAKTITKETELTNYYQVKRYSLSLYLISSVAHVYNVICHHMPGGNRSTVGMFIFLGCSVKVRVRAMVDLEVLSLMGLVQWCSYWATSVGRKYHQVSSHEWENASFYKKWCIVHNSITIWKKAYRDEKGIYSEIETVQWTTTTLLIQ